MTPDFPVWTIRPNWREGVLERLEWLTDVLTSSTGVEQRRALRLSPRRYVEITVNPTKNERSFLDLVTHKLGSDKWLFPLWFDQAKLAADVELGDLRVDFDNTYREFETGGFALLFKDAFTWEVISIAGQDDGGLDLDVVLDSDWPGGTKVYPLRLARLAIDTSIDALTTTVGESVLLFQMIQANDNAETEPDALTFEGMPVLSTPPNRSQEITMDHVRLSVERDNSTGIPYRTDPAERAFQIQGHSWIKVGRQEQAEFREFLYWLRGRQRALWLPSFNEDFVAARNSSLASLNLDIQKIGYEYAGSGEIVPGRDVVLIGGTTPARITDIGAPQATGEERLRIGAGLAAAVTAGASGSFMSPSRLNQDVVELVHHADSDGPMECSLTFQSFKDTRDASGTIYNPIPDADMNDSPCGTFPDHTWWRIRFIDGEGTRYRLRNLEFRTTAAPPPITPCGTRDECRALVEAQITYTEQASPTRAADLWLYGSGSDGQSFSYWASNEYEDLPSNITIARNYPLGRNSPYVGLIGVSGTFRTQISRFAIEWSDDGVNWTTQRIVDTDPNWGAGETRVFFIY